MDAVKRQRRHFNECFRTVEVRHDAVNLGFSVVGKIRPPRRSAIIFIQDQFRSEGGSKSIGHPVASGVHEIGWFSGCAVQVNAHGLRENVRNRVVFWTWTVVDPVDQYTVIIPISIHRVCAVIANPNGVVFGFYYLHIFHGERSSARVSGQVRLCFARVISEYNHQTFVLSTRHNLLLNAGKRCP